MMYYIESPSTDPRFNLALEQAVFDRLDRAHGYFMLWQNDNAIIVGKHQNTAEELNAAYVAERGIRVVRRLSGGGAVYHDLGNINFTFIVDSGGRAAFDFSSFCRPIVEALGRVGVDAEINGRNDITIDGKKFSGNAQYSRGGRTMHHGTILYDSDLEAVGRALAVPPDKLASKGVKSVKSRVTNVRPYVPGDVSTGEFFAILRAFMFDSYGLRPYALGTELLAGVEALRRDRYDRWAWNYGASPAYRVRKEGRVEGVGRVEVRLDLREGVIRDAAFYGDYFGDGDAAGLARLLSGCRLEEGALRAALAGVDLGYYFSHLDGEAFLRILLS